VIASGETLSGATRFASGVGVTARSAASRQATDGGRSRPQMAPRLWELWKNFVYSTIINI